MHQVYQVQFNHIQQYFECDNINESKIFYLLGLEIGKIWINSSDR